MNRIRKTTVGLSSLVVDGELTFDPWIISDLVVQFYTVLFTAQDQVAYDDSLGAFIHPVVDTAENDALIALPSVEKIKWAVFYMEPSSSPGHNDFGGSFYQTCWDIIAFDVIKAGHSLSLAGRKCMIDFVIAASLVHSMMVYYWPRTLLKKIEDVMRNFL
ncbi:hypothetical protein ACS0TY_006616 [Phlomoides rotata]